MSINIGQGGPVVLTMSITNQFDWSYVATFWKRGHEDRVISKRGLQANRETVTLASDANDVRGWTLQLVMFLDPATGTPTATDVQAEISVAGATKAPPVISEKNATIQLRRGFIGTRDLV